MSRPEQTIAYRVYWQGKDLLGTAQIEMPQVQYMTETLSGSGLAFRKTIMRQLMIITMQCWEEL